MKISAFTCITDPEKRQDPWIESLKSVLHWADEIVVVDGSEVTLDKKYDSKEFFYNMLGLDKGKLKEMSKDTSFKIVKYKWPDDFSWEELPKHLNEGLKLCTGDWAIRFDIDYIFPKSWKELLKPRLMAINDKRVATFQKMSAVLVDKWYQKGPTIMALNRRFKDMCFGKAKGKRTDLCFPIIEEGVGKKGVPFGRQITPQERGKVGIEFFNYDYTFKTKDFTQKEFLRFSKAHKRYFGTTNWGTTEEEALERFLDMMKGRLNRCVYDFKLKDHPEWIRDKVKNITKDQFGYNGWDNL